jgi:hypothetical protein
MDDSQSLDPELQLKTPFYIQSLIDTVLEEGTYSDNQINFIKSSLFEKFTALSEQNSNIKTSNLANLNDLKVPIHYTDLMKRVNPNDLDNTVNITVQGTPMFTPCVYNTFISSVNDFQIRSPHYHYANDVKMVSICSHPQLRAKAASDNVSACFYVHNHAECAYYTPVHDILRHEAVSLSNTSTTVNLQLRYSAAVDIMQGVSSHLFEIINADTGSIVNSMVYPNAELLYDDAAVEASSIFDAYVRSYENEQITSVEIASESTENTAVSTVPYFDHILSLI